MSDEDNLQDAVKSSTLESHRPMSETAHPPKEESSERSLDCKEAKKVWPAEKMTTIFTGVIAIWTVVYSVIAGLQWWEIRRNSIDTHVLAVAAQRPWVGLRDFRCDDCTSDSDGAVRVGQMYGILENTGKTPAVQLIMAAAWTVRKGSDPLPDYEGIKREIGDPYKVPERIPQDISAKHSKSLELTKRYTAPPPTVLPPNSARVLPIIERARMVRNIMASIEDIKIMLPAV